MTPRQDNPNATPHWERRHVRGEHFPHENPPSVMSAEYQAYIHDKAKRTTADEERNRRVVISPGQTVKVKDNPFGSEQDASAVTVALSTSPRKRLHHLHRVEWRPPATASNTLARLQTPLRQEDLPYLPGQQAPARARPARVAAVPAQGGQITGGTPDIYRSQDDGLRIWDPLTPEPREGSRAWELKYGTSHKHGGSIEGRSQYRDSYMSECEYMERKTRTRRKTSTNRRSSNSGECASEYQNALRMMGLKV